MNTIFVKISEEDCDELERLNVEVNSRKDLVSYMISHEMVDEYNEQYNKFFDEYQELYLQLNYYKDLITDRYVSGINNATNWTADFDACGLKVNISC